MEIEICFTYYWVHLIPLKNNKKPLVCITQLTT